MSPFGSDMAGVPLSGQRGRASVATLLLCKRPVLVGGALVAGSSPLGGGLGTLVRVLVSGDPVVRGDPADGDLIVSA